MKGVAGVAAIVMIMVGAAVLAIRITAASSAQTASAQTASSAQIPPVAYGFDGSSGWQHGLVKPREIDFGAGGSLFIRGLRWADWTQRRAGAHGVRWADECTPDCASGRYLKSPAALTLSGVKVHAGLRYFSRLAVRWKAGGKIHEYVFHWSPGAGRGAPSFWN